MEYLKQIVIANINIIVINFKLSIDIGMSFPAYSFRGCMTDKRNFWISIKYLRYKQMHGWKVINRYRVLQVNHHIWPHLTFDLLMWPLTPEYHEGQHMASTNQVGYKQMHGWKVINRYRVLQVNLHIWPQLTFDLLMWPLTPEFHGG